MTLIITQVASNKVVQVSDQRLTLGRELYDAKAIKAVCVACSNARFIIGYTGLAEINDTRTDYWIRDAVSKVFHAGNYDINSVLTGLGNQARRDVSNLTFRGKKVRPEFKALMFAVAGFCVTERGQQTPFYACTSNAIAEQNRDPHIQDRFTHQVITGLPSSGPDEQFLNVVGTRACFETDDAAAEKLRKKFAKTRRTLRRVDLGPQPEARTSVDLLVQITRQASSHPLHGYAVGPDCMSAVLHPGQEAIRADYHPEDAARIEYMPHLVTPMLEMWDVEVDLSPQDPRER